MILTDHHHQALHPVIRVRIYKCILYCYPGPRAGLWNYTDTAAADNHASANACSNASTIASANVNTFSMLMYVPIFLLILVLQYDPTEVE